MTDLTELKKQMQAAGAAMTAAAAAITDEGAPPPVPTDPPPIGDLPHGYVSPHFKQQEFTCNHCGEIHPTDPTPPQQVLDWLENIREHFGGPVNINSGYRCPTHNSNVGGAPSSFHLRGMAVDFWLPHVHAHTVHAYADQLVGDAGGVGKYDTFTHIDNRGHKSRW